MRTNVLTISELHPCPALVPVDGSERVESNSNILNVEDIGPGETILQDTQGNGWNLVGGAMPAHEVVHHPKDVQATL